MLIYKEELPIDTMDLKTISLPYKTAEDARRAILHLDIQYGYPCMWYQEDTSQPKKEYLILAIGTGHDWGDRLKREDYIGTLLLQGGTLVLHYFLIDPPRKEEK